MAQSEISHQREAAPPPARQAGESSLRDRVLKEEKKMGAPPRLAARESSREPRTPHLTLTTQDTSRAVRRLEEAVPRLGGTIIKKEIIGKIQIFSVQMRAEKIAEFRSALESLGKIQEPEWPAQGPDGARVIKISILPAPPQP